MISCVKVLGRQLEIDEDKGTRVMTMPNFLVIGAMRSGTTSLYSYLSQHPQIFMSPIKEPRFFALEKESFDALWDKDSPAEQTVWASSVTTLTGYQALFKEVTSEKAIGEASPLYMVWSEKAVPRIKHHIPTARLIAILRNPVERAYSHFKYYVMKGIESQTDFAEAFAQDTLNPRWEYKFIGFYYAQLKPFFEAFDRAQIRIYLYDDLQSQPEALLKDLFRFLEVDATFKPDMLIKYEESIASSVKPLSSISSVMRQALVEIYREDIGQLQNLIGKDLSSWLKVNSSM
jgi:hypothetical protein